LFTSPHLISITERISIDGEQVSEADFARFTAQVKETAEELAKQGKLQTLPTFFEHVTAIALLAFREAKVELAILETGLGGRLDSTTAAGAEIVAITPVAMDHQEYLGTTLREIAGEKAAIIRPGTTAIIRGIETAGHPGRLEIWKGSPRFLFDGAHNPAGARALREYLDEFVKEPITMIFGAMRDKALGEMTAALFPRADRVILTTLD